MSPNKPILLLLCLFAWLLPYVMGAQVESALELMADTASWQNWDGPRPKVKTVIIPQEIIHAPVLLEMLSKEDSLKNIPFYAYYGSWDNEFIWHKRKSIPFVHDTLVLNLIHEDCDFYFPTDKGHQTSPFGPRWGRMHYGLDLDVETGDPVMAAFEGLVRISDYSDSYGNVVVIRHPNGLETLYAHLSKRIAEEGQYVQPGEIIGLGGNTGRSYGSHLHFETRYLGNPFDPNYLINANQKQLRDTVFYLTPQKLEKNSENISVNAKKTEAPSTKSKKSGGQTHVVRSGETLSYIAKKHHTTVSNLCRLNKIKPTTKLKVGQRIKVK